MSSRLLHTTSVRLSLRYALLYSFLAALIFVAAFFFMREELRDWLEDDLVAIASELSTIYDEKGHDGVVAEITLRVVPNDENLMLYQVTGAEDVWLGGNVTGIDISVERRSVESDGYRKAGTFDEDVADFEIKIIAFPDITVVIGKSRHIYREVLESLASVLAVSLIPLFLSGIMFGTFVGRKTETRIKAIRTTLGEIAKGDLQKRVTDDDRSDDIGRVVGSVNDALERLELLVESQQQISADIAHDLKTPIQRLRQRLEGLRSATDQEEEVATCIAETDTIIDTFHALLRIAQIDGGARRERFCAVDLNTVCGQVTEVFDAAIEEAGFAFRTQLAKDPVIVQGDAGLLTQLVSNLIDNALRHCPPATTLELRTMLVGQNARVCVGDDGPGIPADERERVFRRLYRLEKSRTTGGSGLGLSMVRAIADLHGATVTLSDNSPGLAVAVDFSRATDTVRA